MGNKLCKKKVDGVEGQKTPTPFDRIITRLHLRPHAWKSESHLNKKEVNRLETKPKKQNGFLRPLSSSKSSDWTDATLEVPNGDHTIHLRNPKLELIFNDDSTPVPPPRKHKKGLREKIESVAKSGLQAFQNRKPIDEPLFTKTTITYGCPLDDQDHHHHHHHDRDNKHEIQQNTPKTLRKIDKQNKRRKNLSVVSLPNYSELKFSVANTCDLDESSKRNSLHTSALSLPGEGKKLSAASTGKLESYMTRCRSFGSLLPQQLLDKLKVSKAPTDVESDDSFGGLEDWDLRIIEHYHPRDTSLPRPRNKPLKSEKEMMSDVESLIVKDDAAMRPVPPVRRSESLLKKLNREASESAAKRKSTEVIDSIGKEAGKDTPVSITPPPSPEPEKKTNKPPLPASQLPTEDESGNVEHSSLMKILEEYSIREKQQENERIPRVVDAKIVKPEPEKAESNLSSLTPSLLEFEKTMTNTVEDFINAEKAACLTKDPHFLKYGSRGLSLTNEPIKT